MPLSSCASPRRYTSTATTSRSRFGLRHGQRRGARCRSRSPDTSGADRPNHASVSSPSARPVGIPGLHADLRPQPLPRLLLAVGEGGAPGSETGDPGIGVRGGGCVGPGHCRLSGEREHGPRAAHASVHGRSSTPVVPASWCRLIPNSCLGLVWPKQALARGPQRCHHLRYGTGEFLRWGSRGHRCERTGKQGRPPHFRR